MKKALTAILISLIVPSVCFAGSRATAVSQQTQYQGQSQGQTQHQIAISAPRQGRSLKNSIDYKPAVTIEKTEPVISNSFNSKTYRPNRMLPQANDVIPGSTPQLFYQPEQDSGPLFVPAGLLIKLMNEADTDGTDVDGIKIVEQVIKYIGSTGNTDCVKFETMKKGLKYTPLSFISVATDEWVSSVSLAAALKNLAIERGASRIILVKEGYFNVMTGPSKSFGLNPSLSVAGNVGTGSSLGGVAASGMGISSAKAYYLKAPYLQAVLAK